MAEHKQHRIPQGCDGRRARDVARQGDLTEPLDDGVEVAQVAPATRHAHRSRLEDVEAVTRIAFADDSGAGRDALPSGSPGDGLHDWRVKRLQQAEPREKRQPSQARPDEGEEHREHRRKQQHRGLETNRGNDDRDQNRAGGSLRRGAFLIEVGEDLVDASNSLHHPAAGPLPLEYVGFGSSALRSPRLARNRNHTSGVNDSTQPLARIRHQPHPDPNASE